MSEQVASKGVDRAVARTLSSIAAATPTRPAQPTTSPAREPSPADVAATGGLAASLAVKPPIDEERVAQIKKAIANGTFPILPATIADRLLALRYDWMSDEA